MRQSIQVLLTVAACAALFGEEIENTGRNGNLWKDGGFENWGKRGNGDGTEEMSIEEIVREGKGAWLLQTDKEKKTRYERDENVRFSGRASLHIVDEANGSSNSSLAYNLPRAEVKKLRGKTLHFGCRVKQAWAGSYESVGISLDIQDKGHDWKRVRDVTGVPGSSPWLTLRVSGDVPATAEKIRAVILCANGFYGTAEAWYDDMVLTADPALLPPWVVAKPEDLAHGDWTLPAPTNDAAAEIAYRAELRDLPPVLKDAYERPEIKDGTWFFRGKHEYFLGPWISGQTYLDWGKKPDILGTGHIAYLKPPSKEVFDALGFNSAQISSAHETPGRAVRGAELQHRKAAWRHWERDWKDFENHSAEYFKRFGDVPLVMDFAFGYHNAYPKEGRRLLGQYNTRWHSFIPFCPEHPEGKRYYRDYFLGGVRDALRHGANIFTYELFNESSYNCQCPWNVAAFTGLAKRAYGSVERANEVWGTSFDSFDELCNRAPFNAFPGVWRDWCVFSARRYAAFLRESVAAVRAADKRERVYFTEQSNGTPPEKPGMDYRLIAREMDVLTLEGGFRYGSNTVYNAADAGEEVVASSGSRHFYNCDFFQALARGKKPVVNDEHYCVRFENGVRVPSRRADYITSLWLELMHGVSGNYTYSYTKRQWEWSTFEQAREIVLKPSYKSSALLNPYNVPPERLDAFGIFQRELAPFKARLLPFPRVKPARVAIHYSQASMVQRDNLPKTKELEPKWTNSRGSTTARWHAALLHAFYPVKIVFDEDLAALGDGDGVEALVLPDTRCVSDRALAAVRAARERGVKTLIGPSVFGWDEHLKPRPPADADGFATAENGAAAARQLAAWNVRRYAVLEETGTARLAGADAQICDRGDFKLVCLANRAGFEPCPARLRLDHLDHKKGARYTLRDAVLQKDIPGPSAGAGTPADLARGIPLILPPEERVILTLTAR